MNKVYDTILDWILTGADACLSVIAKKEKQGYGVNFPPYSTTAACTYVSPAGREHVAAISFHELFRTPGSPARLQDESEIEFIDALSRIFANKVEEHLNKPDGKAIEAEWTRDHWTHKIFSLGIIQIYRQVDGERVLFAEMQGIRKGYQSKLMEILPTVLADVAADATLSRSDAALKRALMANGGLSLG